jgi:hypothetical protein
MAVKPRLDLEARKTTNEFFEKQFRRIYLVWVIGIAAGAIEIQLDKVSFAGIAFALNSAEKLQGLIYCICVLMYFASVGMALLMALQYITVEKDQLRQSVYRSLDGKKTLLGLTSLQHKLLRARALTYLIVTRVVLVTVFLIPLAHIVFLQQPTLLAGIDLIFHTQSLLPDRTINLHSPAVLGLTVFLVAFWTISLNHVFRRAYVGFWSAAAGISMLSVGSFAVMDSFARGVSFNDAMGRVVIAQLIVYAVWVAPKALVSPFILWFDTKTAYYRFRIRKIQKKTGAARDKDGGKNG